MPFVAHPEFCLRYLREWAIDKVEEVESIGAKDAIYKEFEEWIEIDDNDELRMDLLNLWGK